MMSKKVMMMILFFVTLFSCKTGIEDVEKFPFYISIKNFEFNDRYVNNSEDIPNVDIKFAGGSVKCTSHIDSFLFDTKNTSIENFLFELPAGKYNIEIVSPSASLFGQSTPSFRAEMGNIEISEFTDTIAVNAKPTCALIVVNDDNKQLEDGAFIAEYRSLENKSFVLHPLAIDSVSNSYYTYILPDTNPEVPNTFLWFYGEDQGDEKSGLPTEIFEVGYKYLIRVLE